jgi:hypothetical protein
MSSDGEHYPIEERIIPLVFNFYCLGVCQPYWSCGGHAFENNEIYRVPQVWFYTRSLIYPKLINELLYSLYADKAIMNPWHICVSFSGECLETGFSIEPDIKFIKKPDLIPMQSDAYIIASRLVAGVRLLAENYLSRIQSVDNH